MTPTDLEILRDALHCLRTYRRLSAGEIQPYGRHGHNTDTVISNLELVIAKHDEVMFICKTCDQPIPRLQPIKNRPVTLNKEAWR